MATRAEIYEKMIEDRTQRVYLAEIMKKDFRTFIEVLCPFVAGFEFKFADHHEEIIEALQSIVDQTNEKTNLLINVPIGSGKSLILEFFLSWTFARNINIMNLYVSHSTKLILRLSKEVRDMISSQVYFDLFGIELNVDDRSKINFTFKNAKMRTGLVAAACGMKITGLDSGNPNIKGYKGALIIDDPASTDSINSENEREEVLDIYLNKTSTRKRAPDVPTIVLMQRLHPEDLSAFILKHELKNYKVITVKALRDDNTSYWEEKITAKTLLEMKNSSDERIVHTFMAQYQQEPLNSAGLVFKMEWFNSYNLDELHYDEINKGQNIKFDKIFITADTAFTVKKASDYSVFSVWGMRRQGNRKTLYLLDGIRGKWEAPDLLKQAKLIYGKWKNRFKYKGCQGLYVEDKASGIGLIQQLKMEQRIPTFPLKPGSKDKLTRIEDVLHYISCGNVYLPNDLPFTNEFKNELMMFSRDMKHRHDDTIDAFVYACNVAFSQGYNSTLAIDWKSIF